MKSNVIEIDLYWKNTKKRKVIEEIDIKKYLASIISVFVKSKINWGLRIKGKTIRSLF